MKKMVIAMFVALILTGVAAVAQAVPVELLPEPAAADVACDKCVNEAQLLKELRAWQKQYNQLLRSVEKMPEKEFYLVMANTIGEVPTRDLPIGKLWKLLTPVLNRWGDDTTTPQDKKLLRALQRYGITPDSVEGEPYLSADLKFFRTRFTVPSTAETFIALLQFQPNEYTYNEGVGRYSDDELARWLMQWDRLMQDAPAQPWRQAAQLRYLFLLDMLLFHKNPGQEDIESDVSSWRKTLQQTIAAHPGTLTAALLQEALDDTNDKTSTISNAARQSILARAKAGPTAKKGAAAQGVAGMPLADAPVIAFSAPKYTIVELNVSGAEGTPVWVESAPGRFTSFTVGTDLEKGRLEVVSSGNIVKIYGAITRFDCSGNGENISALDVSKNTLLQYLGCAGNRLTALDVSKNTMLQYLGCADNRLTALDLSKNTALQQLDCTGNRLTALDLSKNSALNKLECNNNQLATLNVYNSAALEGLYCEGNTLTALDVRDNTRLKVLECNNNQLTALDVRQNTALEIMHCSKNMLTALDVSKNTALIRLGCYANALTALDVSKNVALQELHCEENKLAALDVSKNIALKSLNCARNTLTALDVSRNTALGWMDCSGNALTALDLSQNAALKNVYCRQNRLTSLRLSDAAPLKVLDYKGNPLTEADIQRGQATPAPAAQSTPAASVPQGAATVSRPLAGAPVIILTVNHGAVIKFKAGGAEGTPVWVETAPDTFTQSTMKPDMKKNAVTATASGTTLKIYGAVTKFDCSEDNDNKITALDVSRNPVLQELNCMFNALTSLDVSRNTALKVLACAWNKLTALDVSKNTALQELCCVDNQLTSLDVSANTALRSLECGSNPLTALDVSRNIALQKLVCYNTRLTALDVSANTALQTLECGTETLRSLTLSKQARLRKLNYDGSPLTEEKIQYR